MIGAGFFARFQAEAWKRIDRCRNCSCRRRPAAWTRGCIRGGVWHCAQLYGCCRDVGAGDANFADIVTRPESHADLTDLAALALSRGDLPEADGAYVVGM
jgi:hypothetical protein